MVADDDGDEDVFTFKLVKFTCDDDEDEFTANISDDVGCTLALVKEDISDEDDATEGVFCGPKYILMEFSTRISKNKSPKIDPLKAASIFRLRDSFFSVRRTFITNEYITIMLPFDNLSTLTATNPVSF